MLVLDSSDTGSDLLYVRVGVFFIFRTDNFVAVNKKQSIAILFELPVRNLGIATITGATLLGHTELVVFSAAFIVIQLPIMLLVVTGIRRYESYL